MGKTLTAIIAATLLTMTSCRATLPTYGHPVKPKTPYSVFMESFDRASDIEYVTDLDKEGKMTDYWQTPRETIERGKGDCEDISFYLDYMLREEGIESRVVFGFVDVRNLKSGHAWVEYKAKDGTKYIVDATSGLLFRKETIRKNNPYAFFETGHTIFGKDKMEDYKRRLANQ